jgi:hypothetical protein
MTAADQRWIDETVGSSTRPDGRPFLPETMRITRNAVRAGLEDFKKQKHARGSYRRQLYNRWANAPRRAEHRTRSGKLLPPRSSLGVKRGMDKLAVLGNAWRFVRGAGGMIGGGLGTLATLGQSETMKNLADAGRRDAAGALGFRGLNETGYDTATGTTPYERMETPKAWDEYYASRGFTPEAMEKDKFLRGVYNAGLLSQRVSGGATMALPLFAGGSMAAGKPMVGARGLFGLRPGFGRFMSQPGLHRIPGAKGIGSVLLPGANVVPGVGKAWSWLGGQAKGVAPWVGLGTVLDITNDPESVRKLKRERSHNTATEALERAKQVGAESVTEFDLSNREQTLADPKFVAMYESSNMDPNQLFDDLVAYQNSQNFARFYNEHAPEIDAVRKGGDPTALHEILANEYKLEPETALRVAVEERAAETVPSREMLAESMPGGVEGMRRREAMGELGKKVRGGVGKAVSTGTGLLSNEGVRKTLTGDVGPDRDPFREEVVEGGPPMPPPDVPETVEGGPPMPPPDVPEEPAAEPATEPTETQAPEDGNWLDKLKGLGSSVLDKYKGLPTGAQWGIPAGIGGLGLLALALRNRRKAKEEEEKAAAVWAVGDPVPKDATGGLKIGDEDNGGVTTYGNKALKSMDGYMNSAAKASTKKEAELIEECRQRGWSVDKTADYIYGSGKLLGAA